MVWQVYAVAGAFFAGLTAVLGRVGVRDVDSNLATAIRTVVILVFAWGIVAAQGTYKSLTSLESRSLWFLVLSGVTTGLSWLFYFRALQVAPELSRVASLDKLSLVFAVVLAALFLHEALSLKIVLGVLLMTGGAVLLVR